MKLLDELDDSAIETYRRKRMEEKKKLLDTDRTELNNMFCEILDSLINMQNEKQHAGEQNAIRYVYLCQLASSGYTESYKVMLGMSGSLLYLDNHRSEELWYPEPIYQGIKKDMEHLQKLLKGDGRQLDARALLELKNKLLEDSWVLLKEQFQELIEENFYRIQETPLQLEDCFSALCGDYMERLPVIWETQKKKEYD